MNRTVIMMFAAVISMMIVVYGLIALVHGTGGTVQLVTGGLGLTGSCVWLARRGRA